MLESTDNLGRLCEEGKGVPEDFAAAQEWIEQAAAQGNARAQYALGRLYFKGQGVPQDFVQAHKWYTLAGVNGLEITDKDCDALAKQMTPAQIAEAQKMAREWKPNSK